MERDFMGLGSKEPRVMVKDETSSGFFRDSGYHKGLGTQWPFSNKVSALPHFMPFKVCQEDKMRNHNISSGFGPFSTTDAFEQSQKRAMLDFQKSFNQHRQQSGTQHDVYSAHSKLFSIPTVTSAMKQHMLGGIPVTSPNGLLPNLCSFGSLPEPWNNNTKLAPGSPAQMTIFYGGTVNVYEGISPEKAQAIMFLAGSSSVNPKSQVLAPIPKLAAVDGIPMNTPISALSSPSSVSSPTGTLSGSGSTSTDELMAAKTTSVPTTPVSKMMIPTGTSMIPSAIPQARKASLARFLEKRKERMMNASPYHFCKSSSECTAAESNGANFAATSPAIDSLLY